MRRPNALIGCATMYFAFAVSACGKSNTPPHLPDLPQIGDGSAAADMASPTQYPHKLWLAYIDDAREYPDGGTQPKCYPSAREFFPCLLGQTNLSELAIQYPNGYGLSWGGDALIPASKNCVTPSGGRPPTVNWQCL